MVIAMLCLLHPVVSPSTGHAVCEIALGGPEDVEVSVSAAADAFSTYGQSSKADRIQLLEGVIDQYKVRVDHMTLL